MLLQQLGLRVGPIRQVRVSKFSGALSPLGRGSILRYVTPLQGLWLKSSKTSGQNALAVKELIFKRSLSTGSRVKASPFWRNDIQLRLRGGSRRRYGQGFREFRSPSPFTPFIFVGAVCVLVLVLPFIFTFLFPLIIAALITFQIKKRKTRAILGVLRRSLESSTKKVKYSTIMGLQSKMLTSMLEKEKFPAGIFGGLVNEMKTSQLDMSRSRQEAQDLFSYLNARVLDAFEKNELGVREYFLGNDVSRWVDNNYDLEIDFDFPQTRGQIVEGTLVMIIKFPLLLKSSNQNPKQLASVAIAFQDHSLAQMVGSPEFLKELAHTDKQCPMVTTILPYRTLSTRQFILQDKGHNSFTVKSTNDGHREFTYEK
ncbi:Mrx9p LALA0_S12e00782g [Lachancea lanzarotensis]|uniref:LALA0S12e00782g1_1 n=1 Tax=Lachancea lanzarotensis TaxID=1245769 RepID=A0A0C7MX05_9SACH|nr:uncharacterized protein LALA0_S12e00782g [Lachancea lanzarotensis]CEP64522.1 LALA0S12e00782g1_1 [Lachancea lanzarotensis]